ncbi:MAG: hypothetical protein V2A73_11840 [Pseudomonadota bacterium]
MTTDRTSLESRIVAAAKRWYNAQSIDERAAASVSLTAVVQALVRSEQREALLGVAKQDYTESLDPQEIAGMTHRDILKLIASKNNNVLVVARAAKLMKAAGVFGNPEHADSAIYSVVMRRPEFVKLTKGIYSVSGPAPKPAKSTTRRDRTDTGLRRTVTALKEGNPALTRDQALETLLLSDFDFGGKRPKSAVNMAWVALGYATKQPPEAIGDGGSP